MELLKVKDLIEQLQKFDPELPVMSQRDPEGNGYSPLSGADIACYKQIDDWEWEVYDIDDIQYMIDEEYIISEEEVKYCVVVWPKF